MNNCPSLSSGVSELKTESAHFTAKGFSIKGTCSASTGERKEEVGKVTKSKGSNAHQNLLFIMLQKKSNSLTLCKLCAEDSQHKSYTVNTKHHS